MGLHAYCSNSKVVKQESESSESCWYSQAQVSLVSFKLICKFHMNRVNEKDDTGLIMLIPIYMWKPADGYSVINVSSIILCIKTTDIVYGRDIYLKLKRFI